MPVQLVDLDQKEREHGKLTSLRMEQRSGASIRSASICLKLQKNLATDECGVDSFGAACHTSQLAFRSGVGLRHVVEPLVDGRLAFSLPDCFVPMYSISSRNFGTGMTIPRAGLVWNRRFIQSSTSAIRPAATTTLIAISKQISFRTM